jgi:hypothetical protein
MQINQCPKCGQVPNVSRVQGSRILIPSYQILCYKCKLESERCTTFDEAIAKWNELTNKIKGE